MKEFDFNNELLRVQEELLRFAYKLTTDMDKAKDLLQDTLLKALCHKESYSTDTNFRGWLYVIMRNTFINGYRAEVGRMSVYISSNSAYYMQIRDDSYLADTDGTYDVEVIHRAIQSVPEAHCVTFSMYLSGFKYREIAEKTGVTMGTVKSRIFHCRKKLKAILAE